MQEKPTTLYDNASGTGGSITLSQSAANFNYLEVIYSKWGKYYASTKVHSPSGKTVSLTDSYYDNSNAPDNNLHQILTTIISISGTSVTVLSGNTGLTNLNYNNQVGLFNNNELYIHRIIGYK